MSAPHTPGPWAIEAPSDMTPHIWISAPTNSGCAKIEICDYEDGLGERLSAEDWANANLITAAPELLAACENWIAWLDMDGDPYEVEGAAAYEAKMLTAMRRAIAKANGGAV